MTPIEAEPGKTELYLPEVELGLIPVSLVSSCRPGHSLLLILDKGALGEEVERNARVGVCFCSPSYVRKSPQRRTFLFHLETRT